MALDTGGKYFIIISLV